MKKVICDYCGSENENIKEYIFPSREHISAKDRMGNVPIIRCGYKMEDKKKDVCPECQKKIAALLNLVPRMEIRNGDMATMEITIGG